MGLGRSRNYKSLVFQLANFPNPWRLQIEICILYLKILYLVGMPLHCHLLFEHFSKQIMDEYIKTTEMKIQNHAKQI